MSDVLPVDERLVRIGVFLTMLVVMAAWEWARPRRGPRISRRLRWTSNLAVVAIDTLVARVVLPVSVVGFAVVAAERGWGVFNVVNVPGWLAFPVSVLAFDLAIYFQHVLFHAVPGLWRLHRMHHADLELDVTTGVRFHPTETLISAAGKLALVALLGPPAPAVLAFEVLLNATSMFNHGNVRMPTRLERSLRWCLVTPDMHRVHHSVRPDERDSNFGFSLSWWDRLLGTYRAQPRDGHDRMTLGIAQFRTRRDLRLGRMLLQPLREAAPTDHATRAPFQGTSRPW